MIVALLFTTNFALVFTLGLQQINVERRHMLSAALTSPLIGLASLVLFKVLPGPTDGLQIAGYLLGGSAGIVAGIWAHPRLVHMFSRAERMIVGKPRTPLESASANIGETMQVFDFDRIEDQLRSQAAALNLVEEGDPMVEYRLAATGLQQHADDLGETLRLATRLADDAARCDIESYCSRERMGQVYWYDTRSAGEIHGPEFGQGVADSARYLRLRDRIVLHPVQEHLVRFEG